MAKTGPSRGRIPVPLTREERRLLLSQTFLDGPIERRLRLAVVDQDQLLVRCTYEELDELLSFISAESTLTSDRGLETELRRIYDKLHRLEEVHSAGKC